MIQAGATFFLADPTVDRPHRHVVASDPEKYPEEILVVNFTEFYGDGPDSACVVGPTEYSALTKISCVSYRRAFPTTLQSLEAAAERGKIDLRVDQPVPPGVLRKIREGFGQSEQTKGDCKAIAQRQGFFPPRP